MAEEAGGILCRHGESAAAASRSDALQSGLLHLSGVWRSWGGQVRPPKRRTDGPAVRPYLRNEIGRAAPNVRGAVFI
ncbi:MAG: hypothetical protein A2283_18360 [Lentisphaerae bacterium RIFOXYA12_FULL_48_11]|nr:MAG: hypothetical protein A2283_18360 [Lentisphaerae bacterium RIFOXYA12_FULL_48_11]